MAEAQPSNMLSLCPRPRSDPDRRKIVSTCMDFVKSNDHYVGKDTNASAALPPVQTSERLTLPELRPVSLPAEIALLIFEYLDEPYELQSHYIKVPYETRHPLVFHQIAVVFFKPRLWADIPTFQICSATRSQAIKRYGSPGKHWLPFSTLYDSVGVRESTRSCWREHPDGFDHASVYYCNVSEQSVGANAAMTMLHPQFGSRVRNAQIYMNKDTLIHPELDSCFYYADWLMTVFLRMRCLHRLRINVEQHHNGEPISSSVLDLFNEIVEDVIVEVTSLVRNGGLQIGVLEVVKSTARASL
ncbi:hypothetical protein O1611_g4909 [Lasiodiplodia mahajangana]|uniref:Uncharacterized protein n=1 Tax=Lasiodiplodia mahajangana TaxID=1108764 RepID=A0ACC2JMS8_9PEZI|nr:hypothetical protein O1611_g4909 [Lasiodiplodia mahajangana]